VDGLRVFCRAVEWTYIYMDLAVLFSFWFVDFCRCYWEHWVEGAGDMVLDILQFDSCC
jgi:hypothetical protein